MHGICALEMTRRRTIHLLVGLATWLLVACQTTPDSAVALPTELQTLIQYEDKMALAGDVLNVRDVTLQSAPDWWTSYERQIQSFRPVAPPVPHAAFVAETTHAVAFSQREENATATIAREYLLPASGEVGLFSLTQQYQQTDAGWMRQPPPLNLGFPKLTENGVIRAVYFPQDTALFELILPTLTNDIEAACTEWQETAGRAICIKPLNLYLTTNPLDLLSDPRQQIIKPLPSDLVTNLNMPADAAFLYVPSVALVGAPLDETAERWWQQGLANQLLTAQLNAQSLLPTQRETYFAEVSNIVGAQGAAVALSGQGNSLTNDAQLAVLPTLTPRPTPLPTPRSYVVQSGDTLGGIASVFGLTTAELMSWNQEIEGELISVGMELRVPAIGAPTATPFPTHTPIPTWTPIPPGTITVHTVTEGETLLGIAIRYSSTIEAIMDENGLASENFLSVGVDIRVPMNVAEENE